MPPNRFRNGHVLPLLLLCLAVLAPSVGAAYPLFRSADLALPPGTTLAAAIERLAPADSPAPVEIVEPAEGTLVPVDAASPIFRWRDPSSRAWLITLTVDGQPVCKGLLNTPYWIPERVLWERIRAAAGERTIEAAVSGLGPDNRLVSSGRTAFAVCDEPVAARLSFLRKRLPFRTAQKNPHDSQVVIGDVSDYGRPRIVMQDVPVCFNCHAYSLDGSTYGMDMDYKGDKGGYALVDVAERVSVDDRDVISWNSYVPPKPATYSMGLFTSLSPDGRYAASTVGETSAFIMLDDLYFSQMFYPATGQVAIYDDGRSSPPLRLFRFSHEELAAMVPEFVPDHAKHRQKSMALADPAGALGESMATDGR
jgi:hypothetical protein